MRQAILKILALGPDAENQVKRYSMDTEIPEYRIYEADKKKMYYDVSVNLYCALNDLPSYVPMIPSLKPIFREKYAELSETSIDDFYMALAEGRRMDEKTGDIYTTENPEAKYTHEKFYEDANGEDAAHHGFLPFELADGTRTYSALKKDILWDKCHMNGAEAYRRVYELIINGDTPQNEEEENILKDMSMEQFYMGQFTKEEYVNHRCAFYADYVIENGNIIYTKPEGKSALNAEGTFFDEVITAIPDDMLITMYHARAI